MPLNQLSPTTWAIRTSFHMFGISKINNIGLLIKTSSPVGPILCAINAVELSPPLVDAIKALEIKENAPLRMVVLGSDWHHLYAHEWAKAFGVPVFFSGRRGLRLTSSQQFEKYMMDKTKPQISGLSLSFVPYLGFNGPSMNTLPDERDRCEFSVFDPESKTLFIFDIIIPRASQLPDILQNGPVQTLLDKIHGTQPAYFLNQIGFHQREPALCKASAMALCTLPVETIVFSHGDLNRGAIVRGASECQKVLHGLLKPLVNL